MTDLQCRDIYIRLTDPTGKHKPVVNQHRVWDAERFLHAQIKQYDTDAKPDERRLVTVTTRDDYIAHLAPRR